MEKRKICDIALYVLFFMLICMIGSSLNLYAKEENITENYVLEFQERTHCNSVNVVVYEDGKISYYGNDEEDGLYQIGSMTKAFTALGVRKLMQKAVFIRSLSAHVMQKERFIFSAKIK